VAGSGAVASPASAAGAASQMDAQAVGGRCAVAGAGRGAVAGCARAVRALSVGLWAVSVLAAVDSTICRAHQHAAGARRDGGAQAEPPGGVGGAEPPDHGLGRSRGRLTIKIHLACEQGRKPMVVVLTGGHTSRTKPATIGLGVEEITHRRRHPTHRLPPAPRPQQHLRQRLVLHPTLAHTPEEYVKSSNTPTWQTSPASSIS
jgi:hypothetical protein